MIYYDDGTIFEPTQTGVYACRVPMSLGDKICVDKFLMWYDGKWSYVGSSEIYRGEVIGFVGPLKRMHRED